MVFKQLRNFEAKQFIYLDLKAQAEIRAKEDFKTKTDLALAIY